MWRDHRCRGHCRQRLNDRALGYDWNGFIVTKSIPDFHLAIGTPCRSVGAVCRCGQLLAMFSESQSHSEDYTCRVCQRNISDADWISLSEMADVSSISLDLDNKWSYMKTHGDPGWEYVPLLFAGSRSEGVGSFG